MNNGKNGGLGKGTPRQRIERLQEMLGDPGDRAKRVSRRIAAILNGSDLYRPHRIALMAKVRPAAAAIRGRRRTAEDNAARKRDNEIWDAMSDAELLAWFQAQAKSAWDATDDADQQRILAGLKWLADLQAQPPDDHGAAQ